MNGLIVDGLISLSHGLSHSHNHSLSHSQSHTSMKALRAASTQGGGRLRRPPPCVDSFMDECVAVAVAEADQSIHDQSIHDPQCIHSPGVSKNLEFSFYHDFWGQDWFQWIRNGSFHRKQIHQCSKWSDGVQIRIPTIWKLNFRTSEARK